MRRAMAAAWLLLAGVWLACSLFEADFKAHLWQFAALASLLALKDVQLARHEFRARERAGEGHN